MDTLHDKAVGDKPWQIVSPAAQQRYTQEDPYLECNVPYWIDGEAPDLRIMSVGEHGVFEIQKGTSWYPDAIHDQEEDLMYEHSERVRQESGNEHDA